MPPFRHTTSRRRRERGLTAKAIVLGQSATPILHEGRVTHLLPHRSGDHPRRYAVGQRLSVKEMVPGPTACNVIVHQVQGPRDLFSLGDVTRQTAKDLGHVRLDAFWRSWVLNHDQEWMGRALEAGEDTDEEIARRFDSRWSGKLAWLLRFTIDNGSAPRLLAESGGSDAFRPGADGRWVYAPRDTDREDDRGYTSSDSRSLRGELPALTDEEWAAHVGPKSRYREQDRLAMQRADRGASSVEQRYATAKASARSKGYDIRDEVKRYDRHVERGESEKAMRQLERIETRVFPAAA